MLTQTLVKIALLGAEWVLYLLVFLSVLSLAVIIERTVVFVKTSRALRVLSNGQNRSNSWVGQLIAKANERVKAGKNIEITLEQIEHEFKIHLEKFTSLLGTLGANAPFIGLLGTVIGVIQAFHSLKENLQGNAPQVMAGIAEALVATAAGLAVAIPAVVAYNYFIKRAEVMTEEFTLICKDKIVNSSNQNLKE